MAASRLLAVSGQLRRARSGTAAVELALALPLLLLLLLPALDIALAFAAEQRLVSAAAQAVQRATALGRIQASYANLAADAASAAAGSSAAPVTSSVSSWLECGGVRQIESVQLCGSSARYARYVQVTLRSRHVPMFNLPGPLGDVRVITGTATVRVQ